LKNLKRRLLRGFLSLAIASWFCVAVFGSYAGFAPNLSVKTHAEFLAIPLGIFLLCIWFYLQPQILFGGLFKKLLLGFFGLGLSILVAWAGVHSGIPWLLTVLDGQSFTAEMMIEAKGDGQFRWRDRCESKSLRLKNQQDNLRLKVCPNENVWREYSVGERVLVTLRRSDMGSYVADLQKQQ
jgi:hypothetical protein